MDGSTLCRDVRKLLMEGESSEFVDDRLTMDLLWEAAQEINRESQWLTKEYTFSTVVNQTNYHLPYDFQELYMYDSFNYHTIRINNGSGDTFVRWKNFNAIYQDRPFFSGSQPIANDFSIVDADALTNITGIATSNGADSNGESILTDSLAPFANVSVGDIVHNITDSSDGMVIGLISTSQIRTGIYDGTTNDWAINDSYVIVPQHRLDIVLNPAPSVSGYTVYVPYISRPDPVYSLFAKYNFPNMWRYVLTKYAAWMYKYRDKEPNYGDKWYQHYDMSIRQAKRNANRVKERTGFRVNFNKRSLNDRSWR
jgi:hypothetical protein